MGVADDFQARIAQFLGIAPMDAVGYGIAYHGEILMAVGADQRSGIGLAVQSESVLAFELYAADADAAAVAVHHISLVVADADNQVV